MQPKAIVLQDAFKQYQHDQDKIMSPEETIARFKNRLAGSGLNLLEAITRIDNGRLGIPVYFSVCGADARAMIGNYKQMGKGASPEQAQASAVMELAERFSLFSFRANAENFIESTYNNLQAPRIGLDEIARSVSDGSDDLPAALEIFADLPLRWTWAYNLTEGKSVMVPFNWFWAINEFNGSSAGNCIEEAICQGICEVVERHVSALVCRGKLKVPRIDEASITDPVAIELLAKYRSAGIEMYISDFTLDMGIPSLGALAWDPSTFPEKSEIIWTAGTMPGAAKALCRTLTEVAQLAGDFNSSANFVASGLPKFNHLDAARYVTHPGRVVKLSALPDLSDSNIKTEVQNCVAALAERNMTIFLVDVRHPKLDIPAFYTIIPGTHFRERAEHSSVGMMCAKRICEELPAAEAVAKLELFDKKLPGKYYTHFYLGKLLLDSGDHAGALAHLTRSGALGAPSEDLASIYTYMGLAHKAMEQYSDALTMLQKADDIDPERTDTLNLMGFCHFKLGAHADAVTSFERVVGLNPNSAIDYANLAVNHRALGDTARAVEYYRLALSLDPGIDFAREHLSQLKVQSPTDSR
jgi:ribosomal protein S12 methylthiotransferase accessory factor